MDKASVSKILVPVDFSVFDRILDCCAAHGIVPLSTELVEGFPATEIPRCR